MNKVTFIKLHVMTWADYSVQLNGQEIGGLKVKKLGWLSQQTHRGTPSQNWTFIATTKEGRVLRDKIGFNSFNYLKDIKKAIIDVLEVKE